MRAGRYEDDAIDTIGAQDLRREARVLKSVARAVFEPASTDPEVPCQGCAHGASFVAIA